MYASAVSFQFVPVDPGIMSPFGYVPFVNKLFPLAPGYVRTKCAYVDENVAAAASNVDKVNMMMVMR